MVLETTLDHATQIFPSYVLMALGAMSLKEPLVS
jgi:hypothetical protein